VSVTIHIPTPLRRFTSEQGEVPADGATIGEVLKDLTRRHPALERHLYTDLGVLRSFVNVFLNDEDVRHLGKDATPVKDGDTVSIIPSIAGGRP
jgi:molybdopterin converting factor small subunit